jgi:hypothetical protein
MFGLDFRDVPDKFWGCFEKISKIVWADFMDIPGRCLQF